MLKKTETKNSLKTLKFRNRKLVLSFMRGAGAVSVNEISRATGLSKMTVHKIIDHYLEEGMISHAGKGVSTEEGGKKPNLFAFNAHCRYIYAIRVGGDSLSTSIVNLKGEVIVGCKAVCLDNVSFEQAIAMMADAFREQVAEKSLPGGNCLAAVVGCNGIVDVENGVCLASYQYPHWGVNLPIRESLGRLLPGGIPVHVDSWWRHLAHGEVHFAETGSRNRFFLIGNSGDYISGGMVDHGVVASGATGFAGEIGHLIVAPDSTETCVCGGVGCLEALVAPSRIVARALKLREQYPASPMFAGNLAGGMAEIAREADGGDVAARMVIDDTARYFAVAINNIVQICDPGTIVLFGDFARLGGYFMETLRERVYSLSLHGIDKRTRIECSELSDDHGLVGAANHMTDTLFAGSHQ